MNANPLYDATRAYVEAAICFLAERCQPEEPIVLSGIGAWTRAAPGWFHRRDRVVPWWEHCISANRGRLEELPERGRLLALLEQDRDIGPMIGQMVGTRLVQQRREASEFTDRLIWLVAARVDDLAFDEEAFDDLYRTWEAELRSADVPIRRLAPLNGFTARRPVRLGSNITIDRMTDDEVARCLDAGLIPTIGNGGAYVESTTHGIRWESTEPRIIGGLLESDGARGIAEFRSTAEAMRTTLEILRVFKAGHVSVGRPETRGFVAYSDSWAGTGAVHSSPLAEPVASERPPGPNYSLDENELDQLAEFAGQCEAARSAGPIDIAVRRFALASERQRVDDRILDLVISMEALLLSSIKQLVELRYRFALHGACFLRSHVADRPAMLKHLKSVYDARSSIAHGGSPDLRKQSLIDGSRPASVDQLADSIEVVARELLQKSVYEYQRTGGTPDWDQLVLRGHS